MSVAEGEAFELEVTADDIGEDELNTLKP